MAVRPLDSFVRSIDRASRHREVGKRLTRRLQSSGRRAGRRAARLARRRTTTRTGRLVASLGGRSTLDVADPTLVVQAVDYAKHLNDGTALIEARPFMTDALVKEAGSLSKIIHDELKRMLGA